MTTASTRPGLRNHVGFGNNTIEVTVTVGAGAEQPGYVLPREQTAGALGQQRGEPDALRAFSREPECASLSHDIRTATAAIGVLERRLA